MVINPLKIIEREAATHPNILAEDNEGRKVVISRVTAQTLNKSEQETLKRNSDGINLARIMKTNLFLIHKQNTDL